MCGTLEQMGTSGNVINFGSSPTCYTITYNYLNIGLEFEKLTSQDLQGLAYQVILGGDNKPYLQILGVGKLY